LRRIDLDITKGESRTPEFLSKFPNGRIPAVEFNDGRLLFESNAILWHFAHGPYFCQKIEPIRHRRFNGCSSNNTATSHISRSAASS
jgi:Glutathione S-transferase, N-terminal domain